MADEFLDEQTSRLVVKKTWCHGQLIAPVYGLICGYWAYKVRIDDVRLWASTIVMPVWSYVSYRSISTRPSYGTLLVGGFIALCVHAAVFSVAVVQTSNTFGMIMTIFSGLLFIETLAFLCVATFLRSSFIITETTTHAYQRV